MRLPKLTALLVTVIFFASCTDSSEIDKDNTYVANALPMTGSQETPAVTTSATGSIDANYNKLSKILSYKITFRGISGTGATAAHIHGTADPGVAAGVLQSFTGFPVLKTSGTYTGTLFIDGVKFLEAELLAGRYYMNIHSVANGGGEIRGQLILTKL